MRPRPWWGHGPSTPRRYPSSSTSGRPPWGVPPPAVLASKAACSPRWPAARVSAGAAELRDIAAEIEWAKGPRSGRTTIPASAKGARTPPLGADRGPAYGGYEDLRRDATWSTSSPCWSSPRPSSPRTGWRRPRSRDRYRYFVVDEFQDVNPLQKLLLDTWAGDRDELCVVGDPRQTIYSFAGATSAFLTGFTAEFPDATLVDSSATTGPRHRSSRWRTS